MPVITGLVAGGSSAALAFHALYTATTTGYYHNIPALNWGEYAMAGCFALVLATAAAQAPTQPPAPLLRALNVPRAPRLAYAALVGLLAAVGFALIGVTRLALPWSLGSFLAWAVLPILPIAALATAVGILTQHDPDHVARVEPTGRRRVPPAEGIALAAAGMVALQIPLQGAEHPGFWYALLDVVGPDAAQALETLLGHLGAAGIAAGAALIAATSLRVRLLAVPMAAFVGGLVEPFDLTTAYGLALVAAVTAWWVLRTIRLLIALTPRWRQPNASPERQRPLIAIAPPPVNAPQHGPGPTTSTEGSTSWNGQPPLPPASQMRQR